MASGQHLEADFLLLNDVRGFTVSFPRGAHGTTRSGLVRPTSASLKASSARTIQHVTLPTDSSVLLS